MSGVESEIRTLRLAGKWLSIYVHHG